LVAALWAYRAIYYLVPFALAAALYGVIEARRPRPAQARSA
jgi:uncharacterized membrane protein YbhN (UPF0104 family)